MTRQTKSIIVMVVILLGIAAAYQAFRIEQLRSRVDMVNYSINRMIQQGLVEVEKEIQNQEEHQWDSAELVIVRIQNVMEAIRVTFETSHNAGSLSKADGDTIWRLYEYLYKYTENHGTHALNLNKEEKADFQALRQKLRTNGWGTGIGFSSDWDYFIERTNNFLTK